MKFFVLFVVTVTWTAVAAKEHSSTGPSAVDITDDQQDGSSDADYAAESESFSNKTNILLEASSLYSEVTRELVQRLFPLIVSNGYQLAGQVEGKCLASLVKLFYGLRDQKAEALRFIDMSGKLPDGLLDGTITALGDYDGCLTSSLSNNDDSGEFNREAVINGKYCLALVRPDLPPKPAMAVNHRQQVFNLTGTLLKGTVFEFMATLASAMYDLKGFRIGICIPSACEARDVQFLANNRKLFKNKGAHGYNTCDLLFVTFRMKIRAFNFLLIVLLNYSVHVEVNSRCDSLGETRSMTIHQRCSLYAIACFTAIAILSSAILAMRNRFIPNVKADKSGFALNFLACWSVNENTRRLFAQKSAQSSSIPPEKSPNFGALHGIKVLTIVWIIFNHTYLFGGFYNVLWLYRRLATVIDVPSHLWFQFIFNAWMLVDTFFFTSGMLLAYFTLPLIASKRFSFGMYIVHRLTRLIPAMVGALCLQFLWPALFKSPVMLDSKINEYVVGSCEQNWWTNLLFISNWIEPSKMCLINMWYVSADMQLYLAAFLLLILLAKCPRSGPVAIVALVFFSVAFSAGVTFAHELSPTILSKHTINVAYIHKHLALTYCPTFQHIAPYCIGLLAGSALRKNPLFVDNCSFGSKVFLWFAAPVLTISVILAPFKWNRIGAQSPTPLESALYASLHRVLWTLGVAWVTLASVTGHGGLLSDLLKARFFLPLSKLSFCVYLVHLTVIYSRYMTLKQTMFWDDATFVGSALNCLGMSFILAFFLHILFEAPFIRIEKLFVETFKQEREKSPASNSSRSSFYCHCKELLKSQCSLAFNEDCQRFPPDGTNETPNMFEQTSKIEAINSKPVMSFPNFLVKV